VADMSPFLGVAIGWRVYKVRAPQGQALSSAQLAAHASMSHGRNVQR